MKILVLGILLPLLWSCDNGASEKHQFNSKNMDSFIPKHWHIYKKAEGDLNSDGINDVAIVLASDSSIKTENDVQGRFIIVLFKQKNGEYVKKAENDSIIPLSDEGFGANDPFFFNDPYKTGEITIEKGILKLSFDFERWVQKYMFSFQNNDLYLIGATNIERLTGIEEFESLSYNFNTGNLMIEKGNTETKYSQKRSVYLGIKPIKMTNACRNIEVLKGYIL